MSNSIENFNLAPGINIDDSAFSVADIEAAQSIVRQYLSDSYVDLDFSSLSSLNDLNVRPMSQIFLVVQSLIEQFNNTNTLSKVISNPSTASSAIVDSILSNFSISRTPGATATGFIKVVVSGSPSSVSIPSTLTFTTVDGLSFSPASSFVASLTGTSSSSSYLTLYSTGSSTQSFVIVPVVASSIGAKYNIAQYTPLSSSTPFFNFVSASAFSVFSGGEDQEADSDVIARLLPALSVRNLASPISIDQTLRDNFPQIQQISIQGINGELMTRNSHNIFGIKSGSFCDIYVKTSSSISETGVEKIAYKIVSGDPTTADFQAYVGKYVVELSVGDIPGFYDISRVGPVVSGDLSGYPILHRERGVNTSSSTTVPNYVVEVSEGFYSIYGYEYVVFDPIIDPNPGGDSISVMVYAIGLPNIGNIQDFVNSTSNQVALVDTLVRAVVPCIVASSEIKVRVKLGSVSAIDLQTIVINYINSINPQTDTVRSDILVSKLFSNSGVLSVDLPIVITGTILAPDANSTQVTFSTQSTLVVPIDATLGFGPGNVSFFASSASIPLTIIEV